MEKLVIDNHVAVIYSPGYGSGWFTNHGIDELLFDPIVAKKILEAECEAPFSLLNEKTQEEIHAYCIEKYGEAYENSFPGLAELVVKFVPVGTEFRIDEYDGSESVTTKDQYGWYTA